MSTLVCKNCGFHDLEQFPTYWSNEDEPTQVFQCIKCKHRVYLDPRSSGIAIIALLDKDAMLEEIYRKADELREKRDSKYTEWRAWIQKLLRCKTSVYSLRGVKE